VKWEKCGEGKREKQNPKGTTKHKGVNAKGLQTGERKESRKAHAIAAT
jgi:hypothetical protein